jgi:hypothetical protein
LSTDYNSPSHRPHTCDAVQFDANARLAISPYCLIWLDFTGGFALKLWVKDMVLKQIDVFAWRQTAAIFFFASGNGYLPHSGENYCN